MQALIPIANKLQDILQNIQHERDDQDSPRHLISLPQLVVVGSQSSGKSSVLEAMVGKDFLPRGHGIVTRRPLILQLVHQNDAGQKEYGQFGHKKDCVFTDFAEIRAEIERETSRHTGGGKQISKDPIFLEIHSPNVLNLTLVDLPGLTKVPVADQPQNIHEQIHEMVMSFIEDKNALILAVSPANTDLANSDALQLSRKVDPLGERTVGVITKLDLMDQGTHALEALEGKLFPLKLGYVGVVNRSQQDIDQNKPLLRAEEHERQFFAKHAQYKHLAHKMGTKYLAKLLQTLLVQHLKQVLPGLRDTVERKLAKEEKTLRELGTTPQIQQRGAIVLQLLSRYSSAFCDLIDGKDPHMKVSELSGGARISALFHETFAQRIASIDPFCGLEDHEIRMAIRNAKGPRPSLFVPEVSFELLVKRQIARLEPAALSCVEEVYHELVSIAGQCEYLLPFEGIRESISESVRNMLSEYVSPCKQRVQDLLRCELAYINTNHPDFISGTKAVSDSLKGGPSPGGTKEEERERVETLIIKSLMESYFGIVCKNVLDGVPKAIMAFLVNQSKLGLQSELVERLYREELFEQLLREDPSVVQLRERTAQNIQVLSKSLYVLNDIREFKL